MRLCFIGSGIERETTQARGIEIAAIARVVRTRYDALVFGGSSVGLMGAFAAAFSACGGRVVAVLPTWLDQEGLAFPADETKRCRDLAERKRFMFEEVQAVLCYPGGVGTWDELFDLLARRAVESDSPCPPVFLYNWEKYYAPLLLQMETAAEVGLVHPGALATVRPFESVDALEELLREEHDRGKR